MSEQEPGAVEQWLDLAEGAETSIDDRYSVDGYALLAFARAHDAEDARRAALLALLVEALEIAKGAIAHEAATLMQRDLKRATEGAIDAALAAVRAALEGP